MAFKRGLRDGIAIAIGYFSVSFSFGLTAVASGISWWESRVDLADEPDIIRTVCGDRDYSGIGVLC